MSSVCCVRWLEEGDYSSLNIVVWGPSAIRLGFIGAPIATAISFNLISIGTCIYAVRWAPRDAWYPLGMASFRNLGVLVHLGLAGVCKSVVVFFSHPVGNVLIF